MDMSSEYYNKSKPLSVTHLQRLTRSGSNFSVEQHFSDVRRGLVDQAKISLWRCRFHSNGVFRRLWMIFEAALTAKGDVLHITGDVHFLAFLLPGRKTVLTVLDVGLLARTQGLRRAILKLLWLTLPCRMVSRITVISEATKHELIKNVNVPSDRIEVIPVFISDKFIPSEAGKTFDAYCPVILQVGTKPNKNLERLILAVSGLCCRLLVVGHLTQQQRELLVENQVHFENRYDLSETEIIAAYHSCDMLAFASTYEGFGMPILEAQATGKPVVTSNLLSMPEVGGDAACYVDPYSVESIRDGIRNVLESEDYRNKLIRLGFQNVKRFKAETVCQQYLQLYRDIAESKQTNGIDCA